MLGRNRAQSTKERIIIPSPTRRSLSDASSCTNRHNRRSILSIDGFPYIGVSTAQSEVSKQSENDTGIRQLRPAIVVETRNSLKFHAISNQSYLRSKCTKPSLPGATLNNTRSSVRENVCSISKKRKKRNHLVTQP